MDLDNVSEEMKNQIAALFQRQDRNATQRPSSKGKGSTARTGESSLSSAFAASSSTVKDPSSSKSGGRANQNSRNSNPSNPTSTRSRPPPASVETCSEGSSTSSGSEDRPTDKNAPEGAPSAMPSAPHKGSKPTASTTVPSATKKAVNVTKTASSNTVEQGNQYKRVNFSSQSNSGYFQPPRPTTINEEEESGHTTGDTSSSSKSVEEHALQFLAAVGGDSTRNTSSVTKFSNSRQTNHLTVPNLVHSIPNASVPTSNNSSARSTSPNPAAAPSAPASNTTAKGPSAARWVPAGNTSVNSNPSFRSSRANGNVQKSRVQNGLAGLFGEDDDVPSRPPNPPKPAFKPVSNAQKPTESSKTASRSGNSSNQSRSRDSEHERHHHDEVLFGNRHGGTTNDTARVYDVYKGIWKPEDTADIHVKVETPGLSDGEAEEETEEALLAHFSSMKNGEWDPSELSGILQAMASGPNSSPDWSGNPNPDTIRGRTSEKRPSLFGETPSKPPKATRPGSERRTSAPATSSVPKVMNGMGKGAKQSASNAASDANPQSTNALSDQFWRVREPTVPTSHHGVPASTNGHPQKQLDPLDIHQGLSAQYWSAIPDSKLDDSSTPKTAKHPSARQLNMNVNGLTLGHGKSFSTSSTAINSVPTTTSASPTETLHPCQYAFTVEDAMNLTRAVKMIEEDEGIESDTECAMAVAVVAADARKTATYLSFGRPGARKAWLYKLIGDEKKRELE